MAQFNAKAYEAARVKAFGLEKPKAATKKKKFKPMVTPKPGQTIGSPMKAPKNIKNPKWVKQ